MTTKRSLIILILLIILLIACIGGVVYEYRFISRLGETTRIIEEKIYLLERKEQELAEAKKTMEIYAEPIQNIESSFVSQESFVQFLSLLEDFAKSANVKINTQGADISNKGPQSARVIFDIQGEYEAVIRFFSLLDHFPYAGIVENISIASSGSSRTHANVTYAIFNVQP